MGHNLFRTKDVGGFLSTSLVQFHFKSFADIDLYSCFPFTLRTIHMMDICTAEIKEKWKKKYKNIFTKNSRSTMCERRNERLPTQKQTPEHTERQ